MSHNPPNLLYRLFTFLFSLWSACCLGFLSLFTSTLFVFRCRRSGQVDPMYFPGQTKLALRVRPLAHNPRLFLNSSKNQDMNIQI